MRVQLHHVAAVLLLSNPAVTVAQQPPNEPEHPTAYIDCLPPHTSISVSAAPDSDKTVAEEPCDSKISVLEQRGRWDKIRDENGNVGYVSVMFLAQTSSVQRAAVQDAYQQARDSTRIPKTVQNQSSDSSVDFHYFTPVPSAGQNLGGQAAANDGAVGLMTNKSPDGFTVSAVVPGSPAEKASIKTGDVIRKVNGKAANELSEPDFVNELKKRPGEKIQLVLLKAGQETPIEITAEARSVVYQQESKMPPAIIQYMFDSHLGIAVGLAQDTPQRLFLRLSVINVNLPSFMLDASKFFVLDGSRQQLHHVTLDEIRYSIQTSVAQNMRTGSYTPPPPPASERQYTITGTENGNYTLNSMGGGMATINGTSTSTYTVTPQPDYNQLGYSLGLAIRQRRDKKHDEKLVQQAQQALNQWDSTYFKADVPIITGEIRQGVISYWSAQAATGPFRVVLFVTDPNTAKEQPVTFDFQ